MATIEAMMRMIEASSWRRPMTMVPVFKEAHTKQVESFGSFGIVKKSESIK